MSKRTWICIVLIAAAAPRVRAEDLSPKYREAVDKGLSYLVKKQHKDGQWESNGSQFFSAMTALAGTTILMEGSTLRDGKYSNNIRKSVDWLMDRCQRSGLIGEPNAGNQ